MPYFKFGHFSNLEFCRTSIQIEAIDFYKHMFLVAYFRTACPIIFLFFMKVGCRSYNVI